MIDLDRLLERAPVRFDDVAISRRFEDATAMVTGAGGSIGAGLVEVLAARGAATIVCVEHHEPSLFRLGQRVRERHPSCRFVLALVDVRDGPRMSRLVDQHGVDALFHLAAYKHVPLGEENCAQYVAVNVLSTLTLADAADRAGVLSFVYPSTDKAVRPPSIYGATKRIVELELLRRTIDHGRRCAVVRLVNVFGTAGNVIETWRRQIEGGEPIWVTDPRMARYWMTNQEAVMLLTSGACLAPSDAPLMIDPGAPVPLMRTAARLSELLGRPTPDVRAIGWRPGERLEEKLTYGYERIEPSALCGVVAARAERQLESASAIVAELECAVNAADDRWVRRVLGDVMAGASTVA